jgi:hypothetical protein
MSIGPRSEAAIFSAGAGFFKSGYEQTTSLVHANRRVFECHTDIPRTDCQERIAVETTKPDVRSALQLKASFNSTNASILDFWYHALKVYSACHLAKPDQDRILAMAGLAKEVGEIPINPKQGVAMETELQNKMYLSGLWLYDIHHGLLWEEDHSSQPWTKRVNNATSWSWSSLITKVKSPKRNQGTKEAFRWGRYERPKYKVVRKQVFQQSDDNSPENIAGGLQRVLFDPTNIFSCIHIRGKL